MKYVPITNLGDPTSVKNDATISARASMAQSPAPAPSTT